MAFVILIFKQRIPYLLLLYSAGRADCLAFITGETGTTGYALSVFKRILLQHFRFVTLTVLILQRVAIKIFEYKKAR
jgi:hypothetical protein